MWMKERKSGISILGLIYQHHVTLTQKGNPSVEFIDSGLRVDFAEHGRNTHESVELDV